ncbi:hypothetical protein NKG05_10535 [Oerskovia sp. M15]
MSVNKNLAEGETVVMELRTHPKALFLPILVLILVVAAATAILLLSRSTP